MLRPVYMAPTSQNFAFRNARRSPRPQLVGSNSRLKPLHVGSTATSKQAPAGACSASLCEFGSAFFAMSDADRVQLRAVIKREERRTSTPSTTCPGTCRNSMANRRVRFYWCLVFARKPLESFLKQEQDSHQGHQTGVPGLGDVILGRALHWFTNRPVSKAAQGFTLCQTDFVVAVIADAVFPFCLVAAVQCSLQIVRVQIEAWCRQARNDVVVFGICALGSPSIVEMLSRWPENRSVSIPTV